MSSSWKGQLTFTVMTPAQSHRENKWLSWDTTLICIIKARAWPSTAQPSDGDSKHHFSYAQSVGNVPS